MENRETRIRVSARLPKEKNNRESISRGGVLTTKKPVADCFGIVSDCYSSGKHIQYGITGVEHDGTDSSAEDTLVEEGGCARGL